MRFVPGNAQHIGARHSQQDSFGFGDPDDATFISHGGFLAVVCDGMGGMEHGDAASRTAVRAFLNAYCRKTPAESIPGALERSVREANAQVVALAHTLGVAENLGTTLVATAVRGDSLYFISVGDSGLFYCANGRIQTLNRFHVFANVLDAAVARGTLSREDAESHPERESLTSFIGAETLEEIDRNVEPWPLRAGDTILLASDGLFKTLLPEQILGCLQGPHHSWAEALVERAIAENREFQDNVTVLSVTIEPESAVEMSNSHGTPAHLAVSHGAPSGKAPTTWTPPVQQMLGQAPAKTRTVPLPGPIRSPVHAEASVERGSSSGTRKAWLWVILALLIVGCAAAAGWWYFKIRPFRSAAAQTRDSGSEVQTPKSDRPRDLTPDPDAPVPHPPASQTGREAPK
jgi:PPM family protein phosphatase